jgi:hypothetical protein
MALAGFDDVAEIPSAFPDLDALLALAQTPDQMRRADRFRLRTTRPNARC